MRLNFERVGSLICLLALFGLLAVMALLGGCGASDSWCDHPNTLRGFVYVHQEAFSEPDGRLDDDVIVTDRDQAPTGFQPLTGAKVKVEETGASLELGERGAFVFHPLPAGTYTLVIEVANFPPVRRKKEVCALSLPSDYYSRPPLWYDSDPGPTRPLSSPEPPSSPPDTTGAWDEGGLGSWGEGGGASARKN